MMSTTIGPAGLGVGRPAPKIVHSANTEVEVQVLRSDAELEAIRSAWSSWEGSRDSDIDFFLEFIRSNQNIVRPHVVVIRRDGRPEALLVGRLERADISLKVGYLRFGRVMGRSLTFSYRGLRGKASAENCELLTRSILTSLASGEADMAMAHCLDSISPLYQSLQDLPGLAARDRLARPEPHSLMRLPATLDQVYAGLSASSRADVRRKRKKMQVDFGDALKVTCIREAAEIEPAIPTVEAIARKTYQRGLHVGFEDTPQMLGRLKLYAQKGWLRIYLVHIGDKPCAFWIGTVYDNIFCSDYLGFDPQFRNYSPGTFLLSEMIKDFCAAGVNAIDFGFGEGDYKGRFGNCRLMESSIYVFAPTLKGIAMNAARTTVGMTDRVLKRVMERAGLLARAKKYWRARIAKGDVSK